MQALVNEHSQLEIDAFQRPQPVKVLQHRCDVLILRRSVCQSGSSVEHRLKAMELGCRKPCECCVAIIAVIVMSNEPEIDKYSRMVHEQ